jgi:hypothetical protein
MTATDMHMMRRIGAPSISPDGKWAVFSLSTTDLAANKRNNVVHILDLTEKGSAPQPLAGLTQGAHDAVFGNDGAIWYLAPASGQDQLFRMAIGGQAAQLSNLKGDISGFKISKDGSRLLIFADRDLRCTDFACAAVKAEDLWGSARAFDQLFTRHWDTWATPGTRSRLFAFPISAGKVTGKGVPVSGALVGDAPSKPFGGGEEIVPPRTTISCEPPCVVTRRPACPGPTAVTRAVLTVVCCKVITDVFVDSHVASVRLCESPSEKFALAVTASAKASSCSCSRHLARFRSSATAAARTPSCSPCSSSRFRLCGAWSAATSISRSGTSMPPLRRTARRSVVGIAPPEDAFGRISSSVTMCETRVEFGYRHEMVRSHHSAV